ncbi:unnamed protein product [Blepharisma stoltei]|uniref:GIY-YIG homing endonuclease n=1 Tax=Blepharisma stoltei TaxID=1481888 RepID=A0AAU9JEU4_9CILI|nr:unnamed protein product [Blepharisma stoltei]
MENIKYEHKKYKKNAFNDANSNKAFTTKRKKKKITTKAEIRKVKTINTVDDSRAYRAALENEEISYLVKPICIERHLQDKPRFQFY